MSKHPIPSFFKSCSPELNLAASAAKAAGEIIQSGFGQVHQAEAKGIGDLVSEIDQKADFAAAKVLNSIRSPLPILSEELSPELSDDAKEFWIVDPLDGTSAFLFRTGNHFSSVIVAHYREGETHLGIVYFPLTEEWFYAEKGQGAFVNGKSLRSDRHCRLNGGWVELNQYSDSSLETEKFSQLRNQLRTAQGAALVTQNAPYSGVAMRVADPESLIVGAVHDNQPSSVKQAPWDIAGPQLILEEAGGMCINLEGKQVDPFRPETFLVAANEKIAESILDLLK